MLLLLYKEKTGVFEENKTDCLALNGVIVIEMIILY